MNPTSGFMSGSGGYSLSGGTASAGTTSSTFSDLMSVDGTFDFSSNKPSKSNIHTYMIAGFGIVAVVLAVVLIKKV